MDKRYGILIICAVILVTSIAGTASAKTWYVDDDGGADFTEIQDAISAASDGDTIEVYSGTYQGHVNVYKQLILRGVDTGGGKPVVDRLIGGQAAFHLEANGITLVGFNVTNCSSGIYVLSDYNSIIGNDISSAHTSAGIHLTSGSDHNYITGNNVSDNLYGILLVWNHNNDITGNTASNNNVGITLSGTLLVGTYNHNITRNIVSNNNVGIHLNSARYNNIANNTVCNNRDEGIYLNSSSNNNITNNTACRNSYGIRLHYSSQNNVTNNTACNNIYGLYLDFNSNDNNIKNNSACNNVRDGMSVFTYNNNVKGNTALNNNQYGINLGGNHNTITLNNVSNNYLGIRLNHASYNTISFNTASYNHYAGVFLLSSSHNNITNNNVSNNVFFGCDLQESVQNMIFLNNFINNSDNGRDASFYNSWNSTFAGNYWSDYIGSDANGDGIGDSPYHIDFPYDYLPLMQPVALPSGPIPIPRGYIMVGWTLSYGAGKSDAYLIKTDSNGTVEWSRTFGGDDNDEGHSVQQTRDRGYIIVGWTTSYGAGESDIYLIKTDSNGNEVWNKTFGGADKEGSRSVQQTNDSGYIIVGSTSSYGAAKSDVLLIKTDSNGDKEWSKRFGAADNEGGYSVQQTRDGGYIIVGWTSSFGAGGSDVCLIKTDSNGDMGWIKTFGGANNDYGWSVQQTKDEGYIIGGCTSSYGDGKNDVYLIKTNSSGNTEWSRSFGGADNDYGWSVQQTKDKGYITVGCTNSYGDGKSDVYLIKTDSSGNTEWSRTFGGTDNDEGHSVQQTKGGGYIIVGWTSSFGAGKSDVYQIKTDSNGIMEWSRTFGGTKIDGGLSVQRT